MNCITRILLLITSIVCPFIATAGVFSQPLSEETVLSYELYSGNINSDSILTSSPNDSLFHPFKEGRLTKGKEYWLRVTVNNTKLKEQDNYIHFSDNFSRVGLWQENDSNQWVIKSVGGYNVAYSQREKGFIINDKLLFHATNEGKTTLLISVFQPVNDVVFKNQCKIIPGSTFEKRNTLVGNTQFLFAGMIFILCLISLVLFFLTRAPVYLMYFLYILFTECYFLSFFNILEIYFFFNNPVVDRYIFFCTTVSQVLYLWFLYHALKREQYNKNLKPIKSYAIFATVVVLAVLIISLFGYERGEFASDIFTSINSLVLFYIIFKLYNNVSKTIKIILIGLSILLINVGITFVLNLFEALNWHIVFYQTGFFFELLFFTFAINYTYFVERNARINAMLEVSLIETERLKSEKEALTLKNKVDQSNRSLALKATEISKNNQLIKQLIAQLTTLEKKDKVSKQDIALIKSNLGSTLKQNNWEEFEVYFTEVHPAFYKTLNEKYPSLTAGETRLCAFIRLSFSTKEISALTGKTTASIEVARSRLRKKMGVNPSANLHSVILNI